VKLSPGALIGPQSLQVFEGLIDPLLAARK
jgi:hypothetical protein